jgi:hypothetical protein
MWGSPLFHVYYEDDYYRDCYQNMKLVRRVVSVPSIH